MKPLDLLELTVLAAIWGASFLFMRLAVPEFGPFALVAVRLGAASAVLLALLAWRRQWAGMAQHWRALVFIGAVNSAVPFVLFSYAALSISAGLSSLLNATAPLWTALVAFVWLRQTLSLLRALGLVLGFVGVAFLASDQASFKAGDDHAGLWAVGACLVATLCYGISANATRRYLAAVPALTVTAGSQTAASLMLLPLAVWQWPQAMPGPAAWGSALSLALLCTAIALVMYFRLLQRVGPTQAVSVTFLIPVFGMLWGGLFLHEQVSARMLAGGAVVMLGLALAVGLIDPKSR